MKLLSTLLVGVSALSLLVNGQATTMTDEL